MLTRIVRAVIGPRAAMSPRAAKGNHIFSKDNGRFQNIDEKQSWKFAKVLVVCFVLKADDSEDYIFFENMRRLIQTHLLFCMGPHLLIRVIPRVCEIGA